MQFSVGWVLSKSFGIWFKNFIPFVLLSAAVHIPLIVYTWFTMGQIEHSPDPAQTQLIWTWVNFAAGMVLGNITSGAIIYGVVEELRGAHSSFGDSIGVGIRRLLPVIGVAVLVLVCISIGFLLLFVPGVIVSCMLFVAVPAAVCERPGLFGALQRSKALTTGFKGSIFGMLFLLGLMGGVIGFVLRLAFPTTLEGVKIYSFVAIGVDAVLSALTAVVSAVTYATLRKDREGTDAEELARVFT